MQDMIWEIIGAVVLILLTALMTALLVHRRLGKRMGEFQDNILKKQREEVQNIYQTMRGWRHDYHNHMQIIKAYLDQNQVQETLAYLEHLEEDLDSIDIAIRTGNVSRNAVSPKW